MLVLSISPGCLSELRPALVIGRTENNNREGQTQGCQYLWPKRLRLVRSTYLTSGSLALKLKDLITFNCVNRGFMQTWSRRNGLEP